MINISGLHSSGFEQQVSGSQMRLKVCKLSLVWRLVRSVRSVCDGGELLTIKVQLASFVCLMTETLNSVRPDQRLTPALSTILAVEVEGGWWSDYLWHYEAAFDFLSI